MDRFNVSTSQKTPIQFPPSSSPASSSSAPAAPATPIPAPPVEKYRTGKKSGSSVPLTSASMAKGILHWLDQITATLVQRDEDVFDTSARVER